MNRKIIFIFLITCISAFMIACNKSSKSEQEDKMTAKTASIIDSNGADPWIFQDDMYYYYTKTTGNNVTIFRSENLTDISTGESHIIYEPQDDLENIWAPEIHYIDDAWYVYFAANLVGVEMHTMYVLENNNKNPFEGEWTCTAIKGMDDKFAIDGTILTAGTSRYFIWSGWKGYENVRQDIYIASMISPKEIKNEKILLSMPEYDWEKQGTPLINEAPQVIQKKDTINLFYSASGSWTDDYCLGLLTADINADLLNPDSWKKEVKPVFSSDNGIYGPGHNGFASSKDTSEDYIIYHAARWQGSGWNRSIRFQKIDFDNSGKFIPSSPSMSNQLLDIPSGEPARYQYTIDDFKYTEGIKIKMDKESISGKVVTGFEDTSDNLQVNCRIAQEGMYTISVYTKIENCYDEKNIINLDISVNDILHTKEVYPSEYYQPISLKLKLKKGNNQIVIHSEAGADQISIQHIEIAKIGHS